MHLKVYIFKLQKSFYCTYVFNKWKQKLADVQGYSVFGLKRVLNFTLHTSLLPKNDLKTLDALVLGKYPVVKRLR